MAGERAHDWDGSYAGPQPAPWDIGRPQAAFEELAAGGGLVGRVLDIGCGTGEHALMAAALGQEVLGIDWAPRAIEAARTKAAARGLVTATFTVGDVLDLQHRQDRFDTVLDCGLWHGLADDERPRLLGGLATVLHPGGRYHLLCCSDRFPGGWGPRRISEADLRASFSLDGGDEWRIERIEATTLALTIDPPEMAAWHATVVRR